MPVLSELHCLWRNLGLPARDVGRVANVFADLARRYGEPHRQYHNFVHIDVCLAHWAENQAAGRWQAPALVAAAIWLHDSVYDTHATDNEAQSADLANRLLPLPPAQRAVVHNLILDTRHQSRPATADGRLLADIDLAGIGGSSAAFAIGCRQIRAEYSWVPPTVYAEKRSQFLRGLLERPAIYYTQQYRDRLEAPARRNLQEELNRLQQM